MRIGKGPPVIESYERIMKDVISLATKEVFDGINNLNSDTDFATQNLAGVQELSSETQHSRTLKNEFLIRVKVEFELMKTRSHNLGRAGELYLL